MTDKEKLIMRIADTMLVLELGIIEILREAGEAFSDKDFEPSEKGIRDRTLAVIEEAKKTYNVDVSFDEAYEIVKFAVEKAYGRIEDNGN
ncbi:MAG: hypothetical protein QXP07_00655 [Candidatus Parvarchaeum sp.]|nr:hypothetical protein [Candidatus Parvarchaeum tengchongense]